MTHCKAHHIVWYTRQGPTLLDNLIPVCEEHHHLLHEGGWNLTMTPDRTVTWTRPDGSVSRVHHSPNRRRGTSSTGSSGRADGGRPPDRPDAATVQVARLASSHG